VESARPATEADLDPVAELAAAAVAELAAEKGGAVWQRREARAEPVRPGLAAQLADDDARLVVGCIDDVVVGYGAVHVEHLRDGGRLGVVTDLYVEPGARGIGVGEAMMDHLLAWCRDRRCDGVDSIALPGTRATKNFFERFGLVARAIVVHRSLRGDDGDDDEEATAR
jgi:GNAT superfamily N-acetyltransferase